MELAEGWGAEEAGYLIGFSDGLGTRRLDRLRSREAYVSCPTSSVELHLDRTMAFLGVYNR